MKDSLTKIQQNSIQWFVRLSHPQKIYLTALLSLIVFNGNLKLAAAIAFMAMILECLPIVTYVWHTLIGKAIILLSYALIANFALANAASLVNGVVGVASAQFSYSHNFATLLYVPTWMVGLTIVGLMMVQVVLVGYIQLLLLLRMIGFTKKWQLSKYPYLITTMFVRIFMTSLVLWVIYEANISEFEDRTKGSVITVSVEKDAQSQFQHQEQNGKEVHAQELSEIKADPDSSSMEKFFTESVSSFFSQKLNNKKQLASEQVSFASILVAHFVYYFDSDEFSRCELTTKSHGIELNDYEVLQITPNPKRPLGYDFVVRTCISPAFPESYYNK